MPALITQVSMWRFLQFRTMARKAFYAPNFRISPQSKHITIQESLMSPNVEDLDQPALYNHPDP
jgi:hypothetical protein